MKKFVMLDSHTLPDADFHQEMEILKAAGIECVLASCKSREEVIAQAADAEYLGCNYYRIDEALLKDLPHVKVIVRYGIGYDVVNVDDCTKRGILLCNLPTYCLEDVAIHAMALILDISRKTTLFDREIREGRWNVGYGYEMHRLSGRTLGLVGFGNIAKKLCVYAKSFGMNVVISDPFISKEKADEFGVKAVSLDELLENSDVISLHCPLNDTTRHLINKNSLKKVKKGALLVNTSRGGLICNEDLIEAVKAGIITAAGLDVTEDEPVKDKNHPLLGCENIVLTPHCAYNSVEASDEQHRQVAQTVVNYDQGNIPTNTVNRKQLGL